MKIKKTHFFISFCLCLFLIVQTTAQKKVEYNFPSGITEYNKKNLLAILETGRVLYAENCSGCHGIFTKGKDTIPNFSQVQFDNYLAGFARKDPTSHAVALDMELGDLNSILAFLKYYKRPTIDSTEVPGALIAK